MFILCHFIRAVLNIQELVYFEWKLKEIIKGCAGVKYWAMVLVPFSEFMLLTNSSANFFIYFLFHNEFRHIIQNRRDHLSTMFKDKMVHSRTNCGNMFRAIWTRNSRRPFFVSTNSNCKKPGNEPVRFNDPKSSNKIESLDMIEMQDGVV